MRRVRRSVFLFSVFFVLATVQSAHAHKRVALVIGNSAYQHTAKLANPKNDATDMASALKQRGFQVIDGFDLDKAAFDRKVRDFATELKGADAGVFFYAGHALQAGAQNYLVPVDAKAESEEALDFEMLKVELVHRAMERSTTTNILFLDACRDNPLARNLARSMGTRSAQIGKGLASIESGVGTLISFSTHPGAVASDGAGRNSPYSGALVKHIATANDDLTAILIDVRNDVMRETQNKQVPWEHSALRGRFYFSSVPSASAAVSPISDAAREWATVDKASLAEVETFLRRHPSSAEADYARARAEALRKQHVAMAPSLAAAVKPSAEPKQGSGGFDRTMRLSGGKTVDLMDGKLSFTMIGTPFGARGDLVGVSVNGTRAALAVGQLVHIKTANDPCAVYLLEIRGKQNEADFALTCGKSVTDIPRKNVSATVEIAHAAAAMETFTMSGGKTRQLQPGGVLLTFIATPYAASGVHAGLRIQGEAKALTVGERIEVSAGSRACILTLREIHKGKNSADFSWQC